MNKPENLDVSLIDLFPIPEDYYPIPVFLLRSISSDRYSQRVLSRVVNSLQSNNYNTIGDILNSTWLDLERARNFGLTGTVVLMYLLQRIADNPKLALDTTRLNQNELTEVRRIIKIESIKKRLRAMGLVI
ncbi:DNA-directed RNA polymerase subunit alpha C-terminal domain-containing protein [Paenibacillus sp. BR2-3]|uniref:DNA-directed RNA polymerase subunit alpha C-terminal domain-containing protein n=1 Tax=Paenibacillus sp. BR2-3 TaxID=3048494 RepID=UPI003977379A